jgi:N-acetylmuramoyl-L-alanine amidase
MREKPACVSRGARIHAESGPSTTTEQQPGACFLVYPGDRSSIRFERLRELDTILADFTWERGQHTGPHADDVRRANQAVLNATRVMMK